MKLNWEQKLQAIVDFWRPNRYGVKEYVIEDGKKHPFAVIGPGGGYSMVCSFIEGVPYAKKLNKMGYSAFVVYYRIKKKAKFPAPQDDLAHAVKDILARAEVLNLDTEGYSVWGSSAGGHLAASFGTESMGYRKYGLPKPGALVLTYPVVTMGEKTHLGSRENLLGNDASDEMIRLASIEHQITSAYPPTFLWCGDADKCVDPDNSRIMGDALMAQKIACQLVEYPGVDHGVGLGEDLACEGWIEKAVAFWEEHRSLTDRNIDQN